MKFLIELLVKNPLLKIVGVLAILYFGLYANKKDPDSVGNRFSAEKVKKNVDEATSRGLFIVDNLRKAEEISVETNENKIENDEQKSE